MAIKFIKSYESYTDTSSKNIINMFVAPYEKFIVIIKEMQTSSVGRYGEFRFIDNTNTVRTDATYSYIYRQLPSYASYSDRQGTDLQQGRGLVVDPQTLADSGGVQCTVLNPLDSSKHTSLMFQGAYNNTGSNSESAKGICIYRTKNVITGMSFFFSDGTNIDGLNVSVYGVEE